MVVEEALSQRLAEALEAVPELSSSLEATRHQVDVLQGERDAAGQPGGVLAEALVRLAQAAPTGDPQAEDRAGLRRRLLTECQYAFTFYDAVAGAAASEAVLLKAQDLCRVALERVKRLAAG